MGYFLNFLSMTEEINYRGNFSKFGQIRKWEFQFFGHGASIIISN